MNGTSTLTTPTEWEHTSLAVITDLPDEYTAIPGVPLRPNNALDPEIFNRTIFSRLGYSVQAHKIDMLQGVDRTSFILRRKLVGRTDDGKVFSRWEDSLKLLLSAKERASTGERSLNVYRIERIERSTASSRWGKLFNVSSQPSQWSLGDGLNHVLKAFNKEALRLNEKFGLPGQPAQGLTNKDKNYSAGLIYPMFARNQVWSDNDLPTVLGARLTNVQEYTEVIFGKKLATRQTVENMEHCTNFYHVGMMRAFRGLVDPYFFAEIFEELSNFSPCWDGSLKNNLEINKVRLLLRAMSYPQRHEVLESYSQYPKDFCRNLSRFLRETLKRDIAPRRTFKKSISDEYIEWLQSQPDIVYHILNY